MYNNSCEDDFAMNSNCNNKMQGMYAGAYKDGYNTTCMCNVPVVVPVYIQAQPMSPIYIQAQPVAAIEMLPNECPQNNSPMYNCQ